MLNNVLYIIYWAQHPTTLSSTYKLLTNSNSSPSTYKPSFLPPTSPARQRYRDQKTKVCTKHSAPDHSIGCIKGTNSCKGRGRAWAALIMCRQADTDDAFNVHVVSTSTCPLVALESQSIQFVLNSPECCTMVLPVMKWSCTLPLLLRTHVHRPE